MASGRKRKGARQGIKPRGNQAAGTGGDLGSVAERDATRQWAEGLAPEAVIDIGAPAPLGEPATTIAVPGTNVPRVIKAPRRDDRLATAASDVPVAFGGTRALIPPEYAPAANQAFAGPGPREYSVPESPLPGDIVRQLRRAGHADPDAVAQRLEENHPGLAARLAQGLSPEELGRNAGAIAQALQEAGARSGSYTFGDRGAGPEIIITDDPDSVPDHGERTLVIEDLDADDEDAGRLLIGDRAEVRGYHERVRAADRRAQALIPATKQASALIRTRKAAEAVGVRTNWTGDEVMDQHAWLTAHYRQPSDDLADYLAFHIRNAIDQDHRTASMFWPVNLDSGADIPEGRQLAQLIARGLGEAESFQVTAPMVADMRASWDTRGTGLQILDEGWLPCPAGFAWLDAPWLQKLATGYWLPVRAVSWERTITLARSDRGAFGLPFDGRPLTLDSVRIVLWLLITDDVAFGRWKGAEQRADKVASRVGRLIPQQVALLPFGTRITTIGGAAGELRTNGEQLLSLICTLWKYLGELIPRSRVIRPAAPAVARRVQKSLKHNELRVITLREYSYIGDPEPRFSQSRNWTCRWWVENFHRHIDPYDDGTDDKGRRRRHEAVPAGRTGYVTDDDHDICAVCLANGSAVRITLVHSFSKPKGRTDLPFRTLAKERTLKRLSR